MNQAMSNGQITLQSSCCKDFILDTKIQIMDKRIKQINLLNDFKAATVFSVAPF